MERRDSLYNVLLPKTPASGLGGMASPLSHRKRGQTTQPQQPQVKVHTQAGQAVKKGKPKPKK